MIRFCVGIRDKLKKGKYEFLRKVFNFPSARLLAYYDSIGGNEQDGVLYTVLQSIQHEYKLTIEMDEWLRMVSLKFDACHICDKVKYNPHTNQLVGFSHDAFDKNVLLEDLNKLTGVHVEDFKTRVDNNRAKQYLIFMINRWEKNAKPMKYVIARYAVASDVSSSLLISEIPKIICALYYYGIIVNNVTGDGASENRSAFRSLSTISMREIIDKSSLTLITKQKTIIPLSEYNVAFHHPIQNDITIFIGGEMPHLIKKIVNALERSGSVKSTDLNFRNQPMTLKMIQQLWLCEQGEAKLGSLRTNFLTDDHFPPRTSFHRMKVFLATQVVSATYLPLILKKIRVE